MMTRLEARSLSGGYPGGTVFSGVSFSVESGDVLTIVGANGSGKSALLETLQGLLEHRGGVILLDGEAVQDLPPEARAACGVGLVSDRRRLFNEMTVLEHLRVGAFRASARSGWRRRAEELQALFSGLPARRRAQPTRLSGGLKQQLALARFGMSRPRVWLLDDPLQGLDATTTDGVLDWILSSAGSGAAVILTGQHIRAFLGVATKAMFLGGGTLSALPVGAEGLEDSRVSRLL